MTLYDELKNCTTDEVVTQLPYLISRAEMENNQLAAQAFRFFNEYATVKFPATSYLFGVIGTAREVVAYVDQHPSSPDELKGLVKDLEYAVDGLECRLIGDD